VAQNAAYITADDDLKKDVEHQQLMEGLVGDRDIEVEPEAEADPVETEDFHEDLTKHLDESQLNLIASEAIEVIEQDDRARAPWLESQETRYEVLGLIKSDMDDGPFRGSSNVTYQGLIEACVRWSVGILGALVPADGPVKAKILGDDQGEEQKERAERVEKYENASCMVLDEGYVPEVKRAAMRLPVDGSIFMYTYRDPTKDCTRSEFVDCEDIVVPYGTVSLETADHFSRRMKKTQGDMIRLMASGFYRTIEIPKPDASQDEEEGERVIDEVEKVEQADERIDHHTLYEYYAYLDLPNFEDEDDDGEKSGIALPYRITIERTTDKVLSIKRDWREDDDLKRRRQRIRKIDFLPGYRFYGLSLYDLIGIMSWAGTGAMRLLLDGSFFAAIPGGFKTKEGAQMEDERIEIMPGVWRSVGMTYDELSKSFYSPPSKEPGPALFQLYQNIDEAVRRLGSTSDLLAGGADNKAIRSTRRPT
jgi:hypothetical protein